MKQIDNCYNATNIFRKNREKVSYNLDAIQMLNDNDFLNECCRIYLDETIQHEKAKYIPLPISKLYLRSSCIDFYNHLDIKLVPVKILKRRYSFDDLRVTLNYGSLSECMKLYFYSYPYNIPIRIKLSRELDGLDNAFIISDSESHDVIHNFIQIGCANNYVGLVTYAHEIAHTQVSSEKRNCLLINQETIPIFIEQLVSNKIDKSIRTRIFFNNMRLNTIKHDFTKILSKSNMSSDEVLNSLSYLRSVIQAYNLLDIYLNGTVEVQKEILSRFNRVFSNDETLEDVLEFYDSSFERVDKSKIIKKIQKPL